MKKKKKKKYRFTTMIVWDSEASPDKVLEEATKQSELIAEIVKKSIPLHFLLRVRADPLRERMELIRLAEFSPEEVLMKIERKQWNFQVGKKKYTVKMDSHRYKTFARSLSCVCCGLLGTKMILERTAKQDNPYFNLYAEENGGLVLMTKDHITPVSKGGRDVLDNYQTMCEICNRIKGSSELTLNQLNELRKIYNNHKGSKKELQVILDEMKLKLGVL
jgi:5-methylcytosine-specific restriction endonuclease McrA